MEQNQPTTGETEHTHKERFFNIFPARELISYGIIGLLGVGLDYSFFLLIHGSLGVIPVLSTVISATLAGTLTFPLNRHYTFNKKDNPRKRFILYVGVNLTGILTGAAVMFIGNTLIGIDANIMKAIIIVFVAGLQYILNKFIAFK